MAVPGLARSGDALSLDAPLTIAIDLTGIEAGRELTLSFDLLGFGPAEHQASHKVWGTTLDAQGAFRAFSLD